MQYFIFYVRIVATISCTLALLLFMASCDSSAPSSITEDTNQPPSALAGDDQTIMVPSSRITLNGEGEDRDGSIASYSWIKISGPTNYHIDSPGTLSTLIDQLEQGSYTFRLTVTDDDNASAYDDVIVNVNVPGNQSPSADAGDDRTGEVGVALNFNGNDSDDPDGSISSYIWDFGDGSATASGVTVNHMFTSASTFTVTLTITDNQGAMATASVQVTVQPTAGPQTWAKRFGGLGTDSGVSIASAPDNSVFVGGFFGAAANFGTGTLTPSGTIDALLAKYSDSGVPQWSLRLGGDDTVAVQSVAVDLSGNLFATGYFSGTADLGDGSAASAGARDIFVVKYSAAGAHIWTRRFGGINDDVGYGVAVNSSGDVFLAGTFRSTVNFGGGAFTSTASGFDAMLVKLSGSNGAHLWSRKFTNSSADIAYAIALDSSGNSILTGSFMGKLNAGCGQMQSNGGHDAFVIKLATADGACTWSRSFGGSDTDRGLGVAVAPTGDVAVTGFFTFTADLGSGPVTATGSQDIFVIDLALSDGTPRWTRALGSSSFDYGNSVATNASGDVFVTGYFSQSINFGLGLLSSAGLEDIFIARFAHANGTTLSAQGIGGTSTDFGNAITIDSTGHPLVTGYFQNTATLGTTQATSAGLQDLFLLRGTDAE